MKTNYEEARDKLTTTELNKLKSAAINKNGTKLRIIKENVQDEELAHELFLSTAQKNKIRNVFDSKMLKDVKCLKTLFSKMIQLGGCLGNKTGNTICKSSKKNTK